MLFFNNETTFKKLEAKAIVEAPRQNYFYPTPEWVAEILVKKANLEPEMRVLEPSAGSGNLCDRISLHNVHLLCIEKFILNQVILTLKGYLVVWDDFLTYQPTQLFDAIISNPPFPSQELHIYHAYNACLAPGGRLVFLMSNASFESNLGYFKRFRKWFSSVGGMAISLPDGIYINSENPTDIKCYLAIIHKSLSNLPSREIYQITTSRPLRFSPPNYLCP